MESYPSDTPGAEAAADPEPKPVLFTELNLPSVLEKALDSLGFTHCTPIQSEVLPASLDGRDIIGQAQTGTGKTAAFLLTLLTWHLENPEIEARPSGMPFSLVITPTRELAIQIASDAEELAQYTSFRIVTLVGGMGYEKQRQQLSGQVDLVVATPGRLLDFCGSGEVRLSKVEILVLDEADMMLNMGFIPDVRRIIQKTPHKKHRQTLLFSATINEDVHRLSRSWTENPLRVEVEPEQVAASSVRQLVYLTPTENRRKLLYNLIHQHNLQRAIIFTNRRYETRQVYEWLTRHRVKCGLLSGEIAQSKRLSTLQAFRDGKLKILVATDVAGRGIHVEKISHVINYNLPEDPENYVHRIGRTGRAGETGISISIACQEEAFHLQKIEALLGEKLEYLIPPEALLQPTPRETQSTPRRGYRENSGPGRRPGSSA